MGFVKWLRECFQRFDGLLHKPQRDAEFAAELESHLQMHFEDNLRTGMAPETARRAALMKLGGLEQTKERYRDQRGLAGFVDLLQDLRFGLRILRKSPGFTSVAVLTLALGIGVNTAVFSLVNGILLASLPYPHPEQLVSVTGTYPRGGVAAMRDQMRTMDVAAYDDGHEVNLTGQGEPVRLTGALVSAELFSVLGARPELGRTFYPGEDIAGQDNFVILSHDLWQQRFGGDQAIVNRFIDLGGVSRQVVGVMPPEFRFPSPQTQVWVPLHFDPRNTALFWADAYMPVLGRLRAGSTLEQARTEVRLFQSRVVGMFPWQMPATWNADVSVVSLQTGLVANVRLRLLLLLGAVTVVVLIACANVANLTLARAATREKEITIRVALGAARQRIARQLITESVILACCGGALGVILATLGLSVLKTVLPADTPRIANAQVDWHVLVFTGALAVVTGLISGLGPALHSSRTAPAEGLRSGGRGGTLSLSHRLRSSLVIAEVAFAVLLVIAAGLLFRSFWSLSHVDPGFRSERVLTARITPNEAYCDDAERCLTFFRNLLSEVRSSPEVAGAALVNTLPLGGRVAKRSLEIQDYTPPSGQDLAPLFWLHAVTPDYFQVMRIPLLAGRTLTDADVSGEPVAIVTAETARRFWPNQKAVGKHIHLLDDKSWRTVVGVITDVRSFDLQRNIPTWMKGTAYVPYNSTATLEDRRMPSEMTMVLRTSSDESQVAGFLRQAVARLNQEVAVSEVKTMTSVVSDAVSTPRSTATLFLVFAGLALVLGIIGIYGVLSFVVSNRTREIGIRRALGAQKRDVLGGVMLEGWKFTSVGIALGMMGALASMRVLSSELYGVASTDPATFASAALLFAGVASLACYIPARRAMQVDPMVALRYE